MPFFYICGGNKFYLSAAFA